MAVNQPVDRATWERQNMSWIRLSYACLGFFAFLKIGRRAKQVKWTVAGCIYSILFAAVVFSLVIQEYFVISDNILLIVRVALLATYYAITVLHSIMIKGEYLQKLEALQRKENRYPVVAIDNSVQESNPNDSVFNPVIPSVSFCPNCGAKVNGTKFCGSCGAVLVSESSVVSNTPGNSMSQGSDAYADNNSIGGDLIDINTCSESELVTLPGISTVLAKRLIEYRKTNGGFSSVDDFFRIAELKPHFVVQIRGTITCSNKVVSRANQSDRRLDF